MTQNSSGTSSAQSWLRLVEKHTTAWFFIGILLVLLAEGSLRVSIGSAGLSLLPPVSFPIKMLFRLLGLSIAIPVAYLFLTKKLGNQRFLAAIFGSVWLVSLIALTWHYYRQSQPYTGATEWSYDIQNDRFSIALSAAGLQRFTGDKLVLAVRKFDKTKDPKGDTDVVISRPFAIGNPSQPVPYEIDLSKISKEFMLGDWIECSVIILPMIAETADAKTIGELIELGGHEHLGEPAQLQVAIESTDLDHIFAGLEHLDLKKRQELKSRLNSKDH